MKILIFSHPRSCSTYLQNIISKKMNLQNWDEMVGPDLTRDMVESDLYLYDNYITKLHTFHLYNNIFCLNGIENIQWNVIDRVYITDRQNITDQICSMMFKTMQFRNESVIDTKSPNFNNLLVCLNLYYKGKKFLLNNTNVKVIQYELFQKEPRFYIEELNQITNCKFSTEDCIPIHNKKDYSSLIKNYEEVKYFIENYKFDINN